MKHSIRIFCGFAAVGTAVLCGISPAAAEFPLNFYIGTNWSAFYYREPDIHVAHTGSYFPGLVARIDFDDPKSYRFYASAAYRYLHGTYDYDGYFQTMDGARHPYSDAALPQSKQNADGLIGLFIGNLKRDILIKLTAGASYEITTDNGYEVDPYFYKRTRETIFGVIGMSLRKTWEPYRSLEINLAAKPVLSSIQASRFSDVGGIWAAAPEVHQREHGWGAELSATYKYMNLWFRPYVSVVALGASSDAHFRIGTKNEISVTANEPANRTIEFGMDLGAWF
ncbi:MAG: hypothetical protein FWC51_02510 [Proteobacteria bacterium]|nr:hypothetical protein [Pseudomonadota bacterium]